MKLEKTLEYLKGQLKAPSVQSDAYQSWINDPSEPLVTRYAWYAYNSGVWPKEELTPLLEALEEIYEAIAEDKRRRAERIEDYDTRTYR